MTKKKTNLYEHYLGELPSSKLMKMKWNPLKDPEPVNEAFVASDMRGWIKDTENFIKKLKIYHKTINEYNTSGQAKDEDAIDDLEATLIDVINTIDILPKLLEKFGKSEK